MARVLALVVGITALMLAGFDTFAPFSDGQIGIVLAGRGGQFVAASVEPGSPAGRAGLRQGDVIDLGAASFETRRCLLQRWCGQGRTFALPVQTGRGIRTVRVMPQAYEHAGRAGEVLDLALDLLYVVFGAIVLMRAPRTRLTALVVWMLMLYALNNAVNDYDAVALNAGSEYAIASLGQELSVYAIGVCAIFSVCSLMTQRPRLRALIEKFAYIGGAACLSYRVMSGMLAAVVPLPVLRAPAVDVASTVVLLALNVFTAVSLLLLAFSGPEDERVRNRWFASTLIVCFFFGYFIYDVNWIFLKNEALSVFSYYLISFALVGPVYSTLRHHLIDLDVAFSRSAVFGVVSAVLVLGFAAAEWVAGKLSDSIAGEGRWQGIAAQSFSFAAAICIGLALRQVHSRTERSVNAIVFRDRERRLRLLRQFAREADVVQDRAVLAKVTYDALAESLETGDFAIYLNDGDGFACVRASTGAAPERLTSADRPVLTVLRDAAAFVNETEPLRDWLIVPLLARTNVIGFLACGPKRDRTRYLHEEVDALSIVAQHVGTSYAMLPGSSALV